MKPTLIFDLDNTLCECGAYYTAANEAFVDLTSTRTGLPAAFCKEILERLDLAATALPNGWCTWRMPRAYAAASLACDTLAGLPLDQPAAMIAYQLAEEVFEAPYRLYPGVRQMLVHYRQGGWQVLIATKGDPRLQRKKLLMNGLIGLVDDFYIGERKDADTLHKLVRGYDVDVATSWVIGDSPKDDIGPAVYLGLQTIEVGGGQSRWAYEDTEHLAEYHVDVVTMIRDIIPLQAPGGKDSSQAGS